MKKILGAIAFFAFTILSNESSSNPITPTENISNKDSIYDIKPWQSEKLANPIELSNCPGIKIVEWRPAPSVKSTDLLNKTCLKIFSKYSGFLKSQKIFYDGNFDNFHLDISLIPVSDEFRNLNDHIFRFRDRVKTYDNEGKVDKIWGYTDFRNKISFVRSDITTEKGQVNHKVLIVFAHEMYHALSNQLGINGKYHYNPKIDEEMAKKFTVYLGLGK